MASVWIENLESQTCPTCDATLIAKAGRFEPLGTVQPTYVADALSLRCPAGHELPRDSHGLPRGVGGVWRGKDDPVREVPAPQ